MDFLYTSSHQEIMHTPNSDLYGEFGLVDDVFYTELERQVLQLTAEDDADMNLNKVVGAGKRLSDNGSCMQQRRCYYNWHGNEDLAAPAWMLNLWRRGNGTGVFIPQVVHCRRKNRTRRNKNGGETTYKRAQR